MKAAETQFLKFLKKSDQLEVPIYQRTYSWTRPECLQLWSDIVRASDKTSRRPLHRLDRLHRHRHLPGHRRQRDRDHRRPAAADDDLAPAAGRCARARGRRRRARPRPLASSSRTTCSRKTTMDPGVEARYKLLLTKSDRDTFMRLIDGRELDPTAGAAAGRHTTTCSPSS